RLPTSSRRWASRCQTSQRAGRASSTSSQTARALRPQLADQAWAEVLLAGERGGAAALERLRQPVHGLDGGADQADVSAAVGGVAGASASCWCWTVRDAAEADGEPAVGDGGRQGGDSPASRQNAAVQR